MKKIILLLLVLSMVVSLFAACGNGSDTTASAGSTSGTQGTESTNGTKPSEPTDPTEPSEPQDPWAEYEIITIAEALAMDLADGQTTEERYYIRGTVAEMLNLSFGEMTLTDETGSIYVYGTYSEDGSLKYIEMTEKAFAGDEVLLHCTLKNYQGTIEINNARLIDFITAEVEFDASEYTEMTIVDARDAVEGTKIKLTGVVAQITYANGMIPVGAYLVDSTNSIYLYDSDLAGRVQIGERITVAGTKDYWILESEQTNAEKFGYMGCNQLADVTLLSKDEGTYEFDKSWITETTVKEIMDTPATEDFTTTIYKVTALVKKVVGTGFTNYYIDDLDGTTGSYCYSQCSGADFAWLDEFDGKICTVYLSVINAKSNPSGCLWRFQPIAVVDEGFDVSTVNVAEHAVKYYGLGQFAAMYTGDPKLELISSVSSDLLHFTGAKLSYTSSDDSVLSFTASGDVITMNCYKSGTVTVTVTGTYGDQTWSETIQITVDVPEVEVSGMTVSEAINTAAGTSVVVKGIVGPSIVYPNRVGFYLIDDTGVIAVVCDADTIATLTVGDEIVLEGVRTHRTDGGTNYFGQTCITDVTVLSNNYGNHEYSTKTFIEGKTLADLYALNGAEDHSTEVYVVTATVVVVETAYYTTIKLTHEGTTFELYMSSAGQYSFLKQFNGQEVTLEVAPCNWNDKNFYKGCVLAVRLEDGTKIINEYSFG